MKSLAYKALAVLICLSLSFGAGVYWESRRIPKTVEIVKEVQGPTVYKERIEYVDTPSNFDALYKCYTSPILIDTALQENTLRILAHDDCKHSSKELTLELPVPPGEKTNWKLRLAVGGVAGAVVLGAGVYGGWKLRSLF